MTVAIARHGIGSLLVRQKKDQVGFAHRVALSAEPQIQPRMNTNGHESKRQIVLTRAQMKTDQVFCHHCFGLEIRLSSFFPLP